MNLSAELINTTVTVMAEAAHSENSSDDQAEHRTLPAISWKYKTFVTEQFLLLNGAAIKMK